jgi:hypothetical protein
VQDELQLPTRLQIGFARKSANRISISFSKARVIKKDTQTSCPFFLSAIAAVNPPIPAPTIKIFNPEDFSSGTPVTPFTPLACE